MCELGFCPFDVEQEYFNFKCEECYHWIKLTSEDIKELGENIENE